MCLEKASFCARVLAVLLVAVAAINLSVAAAEFTDAGDIQQVEAVETLVELGVLNGKEDGSFDPQGPVTRAEMCKIVTALLNGGKIPRFEDPDHPRTIFAYPDISGHWARYLIDYCHALEIISGRPNGNFDPDGTVTGREAAKMLLVTLGYSADQEGYTGTNWASAVDQRAEALGLYKGQDLETLDEPLDREDTAFMVYQALQAEMVNYGEAIERSDGSGWEWVEYDEATGIGETLMENKFS